MQVIPTAQPGELSLGQLVRGNDAALFYLGLLQLGVKVDPDLAIAHCTYRRQPRMKVTSSPQG